MKLRKLISLLAATLMLCTLLPLGGVVSADSNLIQNGGFETGSFDTGWVKSWYGPSVVTDVVHSGTYAMKTTKTTKQYETMIKSTDLTVEVDTDYKLTFWYYYAGSNAAPSFYLYAKNGNTNVSYLTVTATAGAWIQETLKFNSGSYTTLTLFLQNKTADDGGTYYFDDFVLVKDEISNDGYLINGDYESGDLTGWVDGGYSPSVTTEQAHGGSYSLKTSRTGAKYQAMIKSADITVEANTDYKVTFWYYYSGEATDASFYLYVKNGNSNVANIYPSVSEANTWQQATVSFNSGSYTSLYLILQNRTANSGGSYYFDDFAMTKVIPPSFDGYIYNGDFETGTTEKWSLKWSPKVTAEITEGRNDGKGVLVTTTGQWSSLTQKVTVEANTNYQLTAWVKDCSNMTLLVKTGDSSTNMKETYPKTDTEWQKCVLQFHSGEETAINILLMSNQATASGIFDDISLIKLCDTCESDAATPYEDGVCTVCGGDVPAADLPATEGGKSVSEDVSGLAFKFDVAVADMAVTNGTTAVYDNATVDGYRLVSMGALVSNSLSSVDIAAVYLFDCTDTSASYAVRIINIPDTAYDAEITAVPYIVIEVDGVEKTFYGAAQTATYNEVLNG